MSITQLSYWAFYNDAPMLRSFCASEDDVPVTLTSFEKQTRQLIYIEIFVLRQHGHPEREREADPGSDLESDRPLPARR